MALVRKLKRALRGEVKLTTAAREAIRRSRVAASSRRERANLDKNFPLSLAPAFERMGAPELLTHFRERTPLLFSIRQNPSSLTSVSESEEIEWRRDPF
ncbi:MAG TPA: hypothetical protein VFY34_01110, partial [Pyrinomonadaceae bacterium]|nr:hypothetical protein [Pyrinomonadaceae bacterium]